jgi:hypothetical protein
MSDRPIKAILVSRDTVELGEPFRVIVKTQKREGHNSPAVSINGVPGTNQTLRFSGHAGKRTVLVSAFGALGVSETRRVQVQVNEASDCSPRPIIEVTKDIESRHGILISVRNAAPLGLRDALCHWRPNARGSFRAS